MVQTFLTATGPPQLPTLRLYRYERRGHDATTWRKWSPPLAAGRVRRNRRQVTRKNRLQAGSLRLRRRKLAHDLTKRLVERVQNVLALVGAALHQHDVSLHHR